MFRQLLQQPHIPLNGCFGVAFLPHPETILDESSGKIAGGCAVVREGGFEPPKAYAIGS